MSIDTIELWNLIDQFKKLTMPDLTLTKKILMMLKIHELVELEFCLNRYQKQERDAAMVMVERYIPDLLSEDPEKYVSAKEELAEIYHLIRLQDEEAWQ
jgi:hypothetical protein